MDFFHEKKRMKWLPFFSFAMAFQGPLSMDRGLYHKKFGEVLYLDYCCGIGNSTREMMVSGSRHIDLLRVVGIDPNPVHVAIARRLHSPLVSFYHGTIPEMRIPKDSVDMIQIKCALPGLKNKERHIEEMYRILKPKGTLLIIEECEKYPLNNDPYPNIVDISKTKITDHLLLEAIFDEMVDQWIHDDMEYRVYKKISVEDQE